MLPEMLPHLGAPAGVAAQGVLGQVSDLMSAPRRGLWSMLGLPDSGAELLHQTFGADPSNPLIKALGVGAEMAGDPLTYAMAPLGGMLGRLGGEALGATAARKAALEGTIGELAATRRAAEGGMLQHTLSREAMAAEQATRMGHLRTVIDPADQLLGHGKAFTNADPDVATLMQEMGLGSKTEGGLAMQQQRLPLFTQGTQAPYPGYSMNGLEPDRFTLGVPENSPAVRGNKVMLRNQPTAHDLVADERQYGAVGAGDRAGVVERGRQGFMDTTLPMPEAGPSPYERYLLLREAGSIGPENLKSALVPTHDPFAAVAGRIAQENVPAMPMLRGLPVDQLHAQTQRQLLEAMQQLDALKMSGRGMSPWEKAAVAGAGVGAIGTGINQGLPTDQRLF